LDEEEGTGEAAVRRMEGGRGGREGGDPYPQKKKTYLVK